MKHYLAAAISAAALGFAGAACAQDAAGDWTGAYVGAFAEGSLSQFDMDDKDCWYCASGSFSESSAEIGLRAGYDWQDGSLVYGVSLAYSSGPSTASNVWDDDGHFESALESLLALRARLGHASGQNFFYTTAGLLSGDFSGNLSYENGTNGTNPTDIAIDDARRDGAAFGFGFARMLDDNLALELESEYQMFKTGYSSMYDLVEDEEEIEEIGFGLSRATIRVGLAYRF